eukprot:GDKJ01017157.1.p1 GENE.GDKJ01017157.1~~GDKJ01017157.1.p1  ORF type:complete len:291 (-),score=51.62 GDKJ01017157.1:33-905(-)
MNPEFSDSSNDSDSKAIASKRSGVNRDSALGWSAPYNQKSGQIGATGVLGAAVSSIGNDTFASRHMVEYSDSDESLTDRPFAVYPSNSQQNISSKNAEQTKKSPKMASQQKPNSSISSVPENTRPAQKLNPLPPPTRQVTLQAALSSFKAIPWMALGLESGPFAPPVPICNSYHAKLRIRQMRVISNTYTMLCDALRCNSMDFKRLKEKSSSEEEIKTLFDRRRPLVEESRKRARLLHEWLKQAKRQVTIYAEEIHYLRSKGVQTIVELFPPSGTHLGSIKNTISFKMGY